MSAQLQEDIDEGLKMRLLQPHMLSEVMRFSAEMFLKSNYADLKFNSVIARGTLKESMRDKSMRPFTMWRGQRCCGLLIGMIMPLPWAAGLSATDLVFIAEAGGDILLDEFVAWSRRNRVIRIDMGVSDSSLRPGYDRFYESHGFKKAGRVYYMQDEVKK